MKDLLVLYLIEIKTFIVFLCMLPLNQEKKSILGILFKDVSTKNNYMSIFSLGEKNLDCKILACTSDAVHFFNILCDIIITIKHN